jgi:SAM-dependent methyltransferase
MSTVSQHYLGSRGSKYFLGRFGSVSEYGRIFQSLYFRPYCSTEKGILDFGCGDGALLRALPAKSKIGIEINPRCHEHIRQANRGISPQIQIFDDLGSIDENSVDIAISNHSMEHALEPYRVVLEFHRILVPGGRLILVTPFDDWRSGGQRKWSRNDKNHHLFTWSPLNLGNLAAEAGFEVEEVRLSTQAWSPKLFWIGRIFGQYIFRIACKCLSLLKKRREVVCVARKPSTSYH